MKFTKEQLLEILKAKLSKETPLSEKTTGDIEKAVEKLYSFNVEEVELEEYASPLLDVIKSFEGQVRKINSDHFKEKSEWEKNHPDKKDDKGDKKDDKKDKDKLDLLLEEIQTLKAEREQEKKVKTISEKRNSLKSALKGKDVKNEDWINDQLELIHIDTETDIEALTERLVKSYNKFSSNTPPDITPQGAGGGSEKGDDYADVVAIVKKQSHRN